MAQGWMVDLKQAIRSLELRSGAAITVIATVALAVGATTAVYSVVDSVLLEPMPYPESDRIARIWQTRSDWENSPNPSRRAAANHISPSAPIVREWLKMDTGFSAIATYIDTPFVLRDQGRAEVLRGQEVTSGFFPILGIDAMIGRSLLPEDDSEGAPRVVVLGEALWKERFGGRPDVLGADLVLDGTPHTVVGVMPGRFQAPSWDLAAGPPGLWTALREEARVGDATGSVIGRLEPGVSLTQADERLKAAQPALAEAFPRFQEPRGSRAESLLDSVVGHVRSTLWFLLGAVALVLVIATLNIANILAVLGLERRRELAVRAALGAGEGRLIRGMFVESALLTAIGGLGGMLVAWTSLPLLARLLPPTIPRQEQIGISLEVMLFGIAMTGVTALLVGVFPALLAARAQPQEVLRASARGLTAGTAGRRFRGALVVAEVSLAFVLLVGAGLLGSSYARLWSVDRGFSTENLLALTIVPDPEIHAAAEDQNRFRRELWTRLNAIPGIEATAANNLPLSGDASGTTVRVERPEAEDGEEPVKILLSVGLEDYLDVLEIPLVAGRRFDRDDTQEAPAVAIVNQTMARQVWPDESAIGQRIRHHREAPWLEVVGVVADVPHRGLSVAIEPTVYRPAMQSRSDTYEWVLRTRDNASTASQLAKEAVTALSPTTPISRVMVIEEKIAEGVAVPRFRTLFIVGLAGLAAILALLGVYSVLAFAVTQRTKEIGIRMALGADAKTVVLQVIHAGLELTLAGVAIGFLVAWLGSEAVEQFLFEVNASDPAVYLAMVLALLAVTGLAAYLPASRAAAVDPIDTLKND